MSNFLFSSESVTEGHPDKICDQISDAVLDAIISKDPYARVACETSITTGMVFLMGEITTNCYVDIPKIVRKTIIDIGYDRAKYGFDGHTCSVITSIDEQSSDIAMGVDSAIETRKTEDEQEIGAGDQGIMFGFACNETEDYMPLPIYLAHRLAKRLTEYRKTFSEDYLRPDGKTQVTVEYQDNKPKRIDTIVVSIQHKEDVILESLKLDIIENVIKKVVPTNLLDENTRYLVNPTGRFVIGGPQGDSGLTGRKIIVDTYGGYSRHGGGAFSGKDPTKVDRSASYAARYIAKNIVAANIAEKCELQLCYSIGVARPISIFVDTFGTGVISDEKISKIIYETFELTPSWIIKTFDLRKPIYKKFAAYGHMGRSDIESPWEKLDMVETLKKLSNQLSL
ncbi:MAG: methionine adenosyltransferase [Oscillospiraceae bacterium]|nr:methionine adenosyltransferase [Oscillospiraceae bacterium]